jgi:cytochrome P450
MTTTLTSTPRAPGRPPGPTGDFLGLRNLREFQRDALGHLAGLARDYGDIVRFPFGPFPVYLVRHPDYVHQVYVEQAARFTKTRLFKQVLKPSVGNGLLTSDGEFWRRQRRLVQPAFHSRRIEGYGQVMADYARRAVDSWADGETREIHRDMMRLTMAVVSKTLFDADVSADADRIGEAITDSLEIANRQFNRLFQWPGWVPTRDNRRGREALAVIDRTILGFIRDRRASGQDRGDLLSMLLLAVDEEAADGGRMTDQQARDEAFTLFVAGHETTANLLSWAWYLLSQHPQAEAALHAELRAVLGSRLPTMQDLPNLPYTDMLVKETLRLYPPAWTTTREAQEEVTIGGYVLPRGSVIFLSQWVSHRDARFFPRPDDFLPERWAGGFEKLLPKGAYFPFALGPRICIGNQFALMEARLILAVIAQRWRLELAPGQEVVPQPVITLRPKNGLRMRVVAR